MELPTETDKPNHYTVPGSVECFTILQALRILALGLQVLGLYSDWPHQATFTMRPLAETAIS